MAEESLDFQGFQTEIVEVAQSSIFGDILVLGGDFQGVQLRVEHLEGLLQGAALVLHDFVVESDEDVVFGVFFVLVFAEALVADVVLLAVGAHHARLLADGFQAQLALRFVVQLQRHRELEDRRERLERLGGHVVVRHERQGLLDDHEAVLRELLQVRVVAGLLLAAVQVGAVETLVAPALHALHVVFVAVEAVDLPVHALPALVGHLLHLLEPVVEQLEHGGEQEHRVARGHQRLGELQARRGVLQGQLLRHETQDLGQRDEQVRERRDQLLVGEHLARVVGHQEPD